MKKSKKKNRKYSQKGSASAVSIAECLQELKNCRDDNIRLIQDNGRLTEENSRLTEENSRLTTFQGDLESRIQDINGAILEIIDNEVLPRPASINMDQQLIEGALAQLRQAASLRFRSLDVAMEDPTFRDEPENKLLIDQISTIGERSQYILSLEQKISRIREEISGTFYRMNE